MKKITSLLSIYFIISSIAAMAQCNSALWKHVYNPNRFIKYRCAAVTGIIMAKKSEADGDYHIRLKLDKGQPRFLNQKNMDVQGGCLVLEVICFKTITQQDAIQPCKKCAKNIVIPKIGDHVKVPGTFVTDTEANHGWNEIHPVSNIEIL